MNCIIVDDEPLALDLLEDFIGRIPFLNLLAICKNGFEAATAIRNNKVDLIFLDIQMPDITGIQLFQSLTLKPQVIFTTAYHEYAIEGFNLDATDYLLKPFSFERFLKSVNKAYDLFQLKTKNGIADPSAQEKSYIFLKEGTSTVKVILSDILYLESLKDYIKIHTPQKTFITLMPLKTMAEKLPHDKFMRVHRSYIIAFSKIDSIQRNRIVIGENWIPIGEQYKEAFFKSIEKGI
jgi:DNA-binding LytR/AlgR family response regulator